MDSPTRESLIEKGRRCIWFTQLNEADEIFSARRTTDLQFAVHWAEVQVLRTLITDKSFDDAFERLDHVATFASQVHEANSLSSGILSGFLSSPKDDASSGRDDNLNVHSQLILAETCAMRGMLFLRNQSYLKGGYHIRKAWKWYESAHSGALKIGTGLVDAHVFGDVQFGVGMFHFLLSMVPKALSWVVDIVGFTADRERALHEFRSARSSGCGRAHASTLALIGISWFVLDDKDGARALLDELEHVYPSSNALLCMIRGHMYRFDGDIVRAKEHFQRALDHATEIPQMQLTIAYELGDVHFFCNEWPKVIPIVERYLSEGTSRNFRAYGAWKLGFCYWMNDRKGDIAALYKQIPSWVRPNFSFDKWALRKSKQFLETGSFHAFEVMWISAQNYVRARMFREAMRCLNKIPSILKDDYNGYTPVTDCVGLFRLTKGQLFKHANKHDKAKPHFLEVVKLEGHLRDEGYVVPHAYVYMAEMALEEGNGAEARKHLSDAKRFSDYDFDKPLGVKIKKLTHKLDAMGGK